MPSLRRCLDCPALTREPRCPEHAREKRKVETRFTVGKYGRPWRRAVARWIAEDPDGRVLCAMCLAEGKEMLATETDHIVPHRGDETLFWDRSNWQRLCARHHGQKSANESFGNARN